MSITLLRFIAQSSRVSGGLVSWLHEFPNQRTHPFINVFRLSQSHEASFVTLNNRQIHSYTFPNNLTHAFVFLDTNLSNKIVNLFGQANRRSSRPPSFSHEDPPLIWLL